VKRPAFILAVLIGRLAIATPETVFPGAAWEEATPESQGVDGRLLDEAAAMLEHTVGRDGARELVVIRNGRIIWKGGAVDRHHGVWSATKSFTSTVLGLLVEDGKCALDTRVADVLPDLKAHYPGVTLRHLTTMTSGYRAVGDEAAGSYKHGPSDTPFQPHPVPLFAPPGSQYAYWDSAMNVLALALTKVAGEPLENLFRRRVADPIGMKDWDWGDLATVDGVAIDGGSGNCNRYVVITAREMARFGLLFLNHGNWGGRQLVSARWVADATRIQVPASMPWAHPVSDIDGRGVYGFNWWRNGVTPDGSRKFPGAPTGMFWASGHNNNKCFVIPEWQMVIVRLGLDGKAGDEAWNRFLSKVGEAVNASPRPPGASVPSPGPYFPPPESRGGWQTLQKAGDIRTGAGMDPSALDRLRNWLLESDSRPFAAVVIRHGFVVLQVERGNSAVTDTRRLASVSKAVCATVLAIASEWSQQGKTRRKMTFDDRAFDFLPWAQPLSDPRKAQVTVKQLLNHTSGICPEATGAKNEGSWPYVLGHTGDPRTASLAFDPGTRCGYSTHALHHAALVCEAVTGKPYDQFAIEALLKPIGCERWWFEFFDGGEKIGRHPSHGIGLSARDLARIGYCMLRGGRWNDRQVIPVWFVAQTASPTHDMRTPELRFKMNAQVFSHGWQLPALLDAEGGRSAAGIPRDARYKPGSGGQLVAFVPSLDLVVTRQTGSSGPWEYEEYLRRACAAVLKQHGAP
jgi:CubicO group peptidase (beta-lactamase class C family)